MNTEITQAFGTVEFPTGVAAGLETSSEVSGFSCLPGRGIFQFFLKKLPCPFSGISRCSEGGWGLVQCPHPPPRGRKRAMGMPSWGGGRVGDPLGLVPQRSGVHGHVTLGKEATWASQTPELPLFLPTPRRCSRRGRFTLAGSRSPTSTPLPPAPRS